MEKKHLILFGELLFFSVATVCMVALAYPTLLDQIPTRFDAAGSPVGWSSKATFLIWPAAQISLVAACLIACIYPYLTGVERGYVMRDLALIAMSITSFLLFYLNREQLEIAYGLKASMDLIIVWATLSCMFALMGYYIGRARRASRTNYS